MAEVLFYHLERTGLEKVLPDLLEKTLERGWRAVVRCGARERVEAIDTFLWTYRDDSFLPHGCDGEAETQPVWITAGEEMPNEPQLLFLVDGAKTDAASLDRLARCVMIFEGRDEDAVSDARKFWTEVKDANHDATYWKQSAQGRWEKQA